MGISGLLWRRLRGAILMSQSEVRAYGSRKSKAPKEPLRHIKNRAKQNNSDMIGPTTVYVQVVAAGSRDAGASVFVFSEYNRYLFNCGEGTQRLMHENRVRFSRLDSVFITQMNWAKIGGLPGVLLTLRDLGVPSCTLAGPTQLENFLQAIRIYCGSLEGLKIGVCPYTDPVYKDDTMTVQQVPIFRNEILSQLPSPIQSLEERKKGRTSPEPVRTSNRGVPCVLSFVCKLHDRKGHFLVVEAKELGLPVGTREIGPLISELRAGKSITYEGKEVFPADVMSPDVPGPTFIVVDCPKEDFIIPVTENETLKGYHEGNSDSAVLVIHMAPENVLTHKSYRQWMERFGPRTEHLLLNENSSSVHNMSSYKLQTQLHLIHSDIFPELPDPPRKEEAGDVLGVRGECLLKYQLRPKLEWQRDAVIQYNSSEFVTEALELPGFEEALKECKELLQCEGTASDEKDGDAQYPEVVFLGTGSAVPMKTRNVSSTLVHVSPSQALLLDCGEGTYGQLHRHYGDQVDYVLSKLSAVFISHIHADHHTGLLHVLFERERAVRSLGRPFSPVQLIGPVVIMTWLNQYHNHCQALLHSIEFIPAKSLLERSEVECPKTKGLIESLLRTYQLEKFQTCFVRHCRNAFGCSFVHQSGWKLVFSGDTMPCNNLINLGKDATLLIHEATLEDGLENEAVDKAHSTISQAIDVGRKMNAKYVMLNHFSQRYSKLPLLSDDFSNKVGVSFDHMRIRWSDFRTLPKLMAPLKVLFSEHLEELLERKEKRALNQQEAENLPYGSTPGASSKRDLEDSDKAVVAKKLKAN